MDQAEFLRRFDERLGELDLNFLARDLETFLFASEQQERVITFRDSDSVLPFHALSDRTPMG